MATPIMQDSDPGLETRSEIERKLLSRSSPATIGTDLVKAVVPLLVSTGLRDPREP